MEVTFKFVHVELKTWEQYSVFKMDSMGHGAVKCKGLGFFFIQFAILID